MTRNIRFHDYSKIRRNVKVHGASRAQAGGRERDAMVYKLANGLSKLDVHGFMSIFLSTSQIGHPETYLSCDQNRPKMPYELWLQQYYLMCPKPGHQRKHF